MQVHFTIDGVPQIRDVQLGESAMPYLNVDAEQEGVCEGGNCLKCAVLFGNRVVLSCALPAFRLDGATIYTTKGLSADPIFHAIERAFAKLEILSATRSLPAILMYAYQLLSEHANPSDEQLHDFSRFIDSKAINRDQFERAVRLAGHIMKRRTVHEHSHAQ